MMMGLEKEDLGLSLGLGCAVDRRPLQLGLVPASRSSSSPSYFEQPRPSPWSQIFASAAEKSSDLYMGGEARPFLRGIDVNRSPLSSAAADNNDDETALSSPNSTVSSVSGKRSVADAGGGGGGDEHDGERDSSSRAAAVSDEEEGEGSRKKLRLTKDQSAVLEESFKDHNTLNPKQKLALAKQLNLRPRQVEVWFQNRRARTKLKQTEVDCEYLKRCCESLTEDNRRLQKEVQELRALKLSQQFYMQMAPPTTLTMCPSCERVAVSAAASAAAAGENHHHHHHHQQQQCPAARPVAAIPSWGPSPLRVFDAPPYRA